MRQDASIADNSTVRCLHMGGAYRVLLGADDEVGAWVSARMPQPEPWLPGAGRAIGFTRAESLVAGATYFQYNGVNVWTAIASEDHGWISRRTLRILFEYPFRQLEVKRITALIDASNHRSIRFVQHLGFSYEATLVDAAVDGDSFVFRMLERDCKWLTPR